MASIGHNTCSMVASSGFYQSHGSPLLGDACGIVPAHRRGHQYGQQSWSILLLLFCFLLPWQPLGQYGASSYPMAASSGFRGSPGHAASGNAVCIAPKCSHGHQNDLQQWCIRVLPPLFLLTIILA